MKKLKGTQWTAEPRLPPNDVDFYDMGYKLGFLSAIRYFFILVIAVLVGCLILLRANV